MEEIGERRVCLLPLKDCSNKQLVARDDLESALCVSSSPSHSDEWILDLGSTYHICPNREWFSSFHDLDGGVVMLGDETTCRIQGIGSIRLKMHDGTVRVLKDIRYVLDMKKNVISFGAFDKKGYKITIVGGVFKVV